MLNRRRRRDHLPNREMVSKPRGGFLAFVEPDLQEHGRTDAIGDPEPSRAAEESISLLPADFDPPDRYASLTTAAGDSERQGAAGGGAESA